MGLSHDSTFALTHIQYAEIGTCFANDMRYTFLWLFSTICCSVTLSFLAFGIFCTNAAIYKHIIVASESFHRHLYANYTVMYITIHCRPLGFAILWNIIPIFVSYSCTVFWQCEWNEQDSLVLFESCFHNIACNMWMTTWHENTVFVTLHLTPF